MKLFLRTPKTNRKPWLAQKKNWSEFWRVRTRALTHIADKTAWCMDNCVGDWTRSPGGEAFYFVEAEDAAAFKLRWEGFNDRTAI